MAQPTLAEKVAFLSRPDSYPGPVGRVEARETHMSWVFLTPDRVYKMKKPVRQPHLDYSTIARRKVCCEEELRLNRRLAADVYLAVLPLCRSGRSLVLGGPGAPVEWLIEMARLPDGDMLETRIAGGRLAAADVARLGDVLAAFYAGLPAELSGDAYVARLADALERDRRIICFPEFNPAPRACVLLEAAEAAFARATPEIRARAARGRLVEGHGDLRPEHVCLTEPVRIFDCLDFDRAYRVLDPFDEIAYLGLECAVLGADRVGPALLDRVAERLGDRPSDALVACYGALSALTRARLCLAHLLEVPVRLPRKWRPLAMRYLSAAEALLEPARPGARRAGRA